MKNTKPTSALFLFALFLLTGIAGCKKDDTTSQHTGKIKTITYLGATTGTTKTTISYDNQDRILSASNEPTGYNSYVYQNQSVRILYYDSASNLSTPLADDTFMLNAQGYVSSATIANGYTRTYDANGYVLTETKNINTSTLITTTHTYSNGNEVSRSYVDGTGQQHTYTFQYNTQPETHGNNAGGSPYWGKDNANLVSRITENHGGADQITDYTYEYDSQGRVTKETQTGYHSGVTGYTYY